MERHFLGFGNAKDGNLDISSNTNFNPLNAALSDCTAGSDTGTSSVDGWNAGDMVVIHQTIIQSGGTFGGALEVNSIESYNSSTNEIVFSLPLKHSYDTDSNNKAQIQYLPQYGSVNIDAGVSLNASSWDGSTGGILAYLCSGLTYIAGTMNISGRGYRGSTGYGASSGGTTGLRGEGENGNYNSAANINNGAGGGGGNGGNPGRPGGGGGANYTNGTTGGTHASLGGGTGGAAYGLSLSQWDQIFFGGGGGAGGQDASQASGQGGTGGGIGFIASGQFVIETTGLVNLNGLAGQNTNQAGGGGGGAGGTFYGMFGSSSIGTNQISVGAGGGGVSNFTGSGGAGGQGRTRIESCLNTGTCANSSIVTGQGWCQSLISIY